MPRDIITQNFLYGDHGQKKYRSPIWGRKRSEAASSSSKNHSTQVTPASDPPANSGRNVRHSTPQTARERGLRSPPRSSEEYSQTRRHAVRFSLSDTRRLNQDFPEPMPSQPDPFTMYPFSRLTTTVKQCPWMLGSDVNPFAPDHNPDFYLPVPRSIKHDTAVSFVVSDQTRPEQPQFVISCPLEHVDLMRELLAPEGSQRTLSARGSSGHPRDGGELRSMLLDGTPNIELALHGEARTATNGPASASDSYDRRQSNGGISGGSRRHSFFRERPLEFPRCDQNVGQRLWTQEGCAPHNFPVPSWPAMIVPHGWHSGANYQEPHIEHPDAAFVGP